MHLISVHRGARVPFAPFTGERIYMRQFTKAEGLPPDLKRWQATVDAMLDGVDTDGPIFLMVDQVQVRGHTTHRRGGLHVDGYWNPSIWGHRHEPCPAPSAQDYGAEAIILASDVLGCAAYTGRWEGSPAQGGCCAHIDTSALDRVDLEPGLAWVGNTLSMLHESLALPQDCRRTVVRLNVPGWSAPTH